MKSSTVVNANLRAGMRDLERLLVMSEGQTSERGQFTDSELGQFMSILHRLHVVLVFNSSQFDDLQFKQLQEDLRDLTSDTLNVRQRILMVERIVRSYSFLQSPRKLFSSIG